MDVKTRLWPEEHSKQLEAAFTLGLSYSKIAVIVSARCGAHYSRGACIGRVSRMGLKRPGYVVVAMTREEKTRRATERKRKKRWAAKPDLAERYRQLTERRKQFLESGTSKTSSAYRRHVPRLPEMTKTELRAMITTAVQNTAAMEIAT